MNIKKGLYTYLIAIMISFFGLSDLMAQNLPGDSEIGIILGEPTGLSAKFWTSNSTAFDVGLAWSLGGRGSIHVHADYLRHNVLDSGTEDLLFYYGLGARMLFRDDPIVSARIPLGIQYIIPDSRLGVFFEIVPMLNLIPATDFDVNGGLGIRYFF